MGAWSQMTLKQSKEKKRKKCVWNKARKKKISYWSKGYFVALTVTNLALWCIIEENMTSCTWRSVRRSVTFRQNWSWACNRSHMTSLECCSRTLDRTKRVSASLCLCACVCVCVRVLVCVCVCMRACVFAMPVASRLSRHSSDNSREIASGHCQTVPFQTITVAFWSAPAL